MNRLFELESDKRVMAAGVETIAKLIELDNRRVANLVRQAGLENDPLMQERY